MNSILGISLGTHTVSFVVLYNGELIKWRIRTFRGPWTYNKLRKINTYIFQYARKNGAKHIAIKIPDIFATIKSYNQLIGTLNLKAKENKIRLHYYTMSDLVYGLVNPEASKRQLYSFILQAYSSLIPLYRSKLVPHNPYYAKLFDALSAAHFHRMFRLK